MKITHVKSKVVLPEENYWYDINYNTERAICQAFFSDFLPSQKVLNRAFRRCETAHSWLPKSPE